MKTKSLVFNSILVLTLIFMLVGFKSPSIAGVINVNITGDQLGTDNDECSLREAIQAANTQATYDGCVVNPGWSEFIIQLGSGVYSITFGGIDDTNAAGDFDILPHSGQIIAITGVPDETEVNGGDLDRVFDVMAAFESQILFSGLRITNGHSTENGGGIRNAGMLAIEHGRVDNNFAPADFLGGGIYNNGNLTINDTLIDHNSIDPGIPSGKGGGIYNASGATLELSNVSLIYNEAGSANWPDYVTYGGNGGGLINEGTAEIDHSTIAYNTSGGCIAASSCSAGFGGGIYNLGGTLVITNSTISTNTLGESIGSGSKFGAGIFNYKGTLTVYDSTIAFNTNGTGSGNLGGGIYSHWQGTVTMRNSILGNNESGGAANDCYGTIASLDYNLILDLDGCTVTGGTAHNIPAGTDPQLMALDFYGGITDTHLLRWNSPAIDSGDPDYCPATDQRGITRPLDGDLDGTPACDIGAVEADWEYFSYLPLTKK